MSHTKKICICSICIALCAVLPPAFHSLSLGMAFSPLHLPALLCGLLCGWPYGAFCGIAGPVVSSLVSAMPGASQLVSMIPELCTYGLVTGLLMDRVRTGRAVADLYLSLVPAMLLGRVVGGTAQALFYLSTAQSWSISLWVASYLVGTLPGAILQLLILPILVLTLVKARLIPARYPTSSERPAERRAG